MQKLLLALIIALLVAALVAPAALAGGVVGDPPVVPPVPVKVSWLDEDYQPVKGGFVTRPVKVWTTWSAAGTMTIPRPVRRR